MACMIQNKQLRRANHSLALSEIFEFARRGNLYKRHVGQVYLLFKASNRFFKINNNAVALQDKVRLLFVFVINLD